MTSVTREREGLGNQCGQRPDGANQTAGTDCHHGPHWALQRGRPFTSCREGAVGMSDRTARPEPGPMVPAVGQAATVESFQPGSTEVRPSLCEVGNVRTAFQAARRPDRGRRPWHGRPCKAGRWVAGRAVPGTRAGIGRTVSAREAVPDRSRGKGPARLAFSGSAGHG